MLHYDIFAVTDSDYELTTKLSISPQASNLALTYLRVCPMRAINSRIHVAFIQKLKTLLLSPNYLQNHMNAR